MYQSLAGLRKVANEYNAVLIGETWTNDIAELKKYYGKNHEVLQMPMDLMIVEPQAAFGGCVPQAYCFKWIGSGEWPVWVMSNHDRMRAYSRFADGKHDNDIAKVMAAMYLFAAW